MINKLVVFDETHGVKKYSAISGVTTESNVNSRCTLGSPGILAKKMGQPRTNCNKRVFFSDFPSTRQLEHHIKNVSKSTIGKLLKIVVLKHLVLHLHGNEA